MWTTKAPGSSGFVVGQPQEFLWRFCGGWNPEDRDPAESGHVADVL
jgi:hypothetical protein